MQPLRVRILWRVRGLHNVKPLPSQPQGSWKCNRELSAHLAHLHTKGPRHIRGTGPRRHDKAMALYSQNMLSPRSSCRKRVSGPMLGQDLKNSGRPS